mgnify:CR=1 FL=1
MSIDIICIIILAIGFYKGLTKGLIMGVFSLLAFIAGIAAAVKLSAVVAAWLQSNSNIGTTWLPVISFALVFIAVVLIVRWSAKLIENIADFAFLGWVNKIGGALMYMTLYAFILSVVFFYMNQLGILTNTATSDSKLYQLLQPFGPFVVDGIGKIIPIFKDLFNQLTNFFGNIKPENT